MILILIQQALVQSSYGTLLEQLEWQSRETLMQLSRHASKAAEPMEKP